MPIQHDLEGVLSLPAAFEEAVREAGDRTALEYGDTVLGYRELNARANRVARRLRQHGVDAQTRVALHMVRSPELYVVLLALLKAGACVVPLNPSHPVAVRQAVLEEAAASLVVRDRDDDLETTVPALEAAALIEESAGLEEENLALEVDPESTAFILFTSGSTGRPKGVRIAHRGISRVAQHTGEVTVEPGDAFLQLAAVSFAASTTDIWLSLLHGARLVVPPPGLPALPELARTIVDRGITFLNLPCGLFNLLVTGHCDALRRVRVIIVSGEFPSPPHLAKALAATDATVYNAFGCTENSALTAVHRVTPEELDQGGAVPVGRPLPGVTMRVLGEDLRPRPVGEVGEMCLGGAGVAQGYLDRSEPAARKFAADPERPGALLLRTGDLARQTPAGEIVLVGRTDQMVKIRGHRVETREVELAIKRIEAVDQAAVTAVDAADNARELVAFYTTRTGAPLAVGDLLAGLRDRLPDYMHPVRFHHLAELPVNVNGKLDRRALREPDRDAGPAPAATADTAGTAAVADPLASVVAGLFRDIAGVTDFGVTDSFLAAGGTSLHFIQLAAGLQRALGAAVQAEDVFQHDSPEALARHIEAVRDGATAAPGR
ncbi:amino acid adenylation domain-containing protein [Thermomonospora echinospora]|uniref:Amino acid adenylation domain-containing protein n=1 Tax=Thermomonospora echinospora TaxID=1992 RepID=A0A1H6DF23_9ACTN|nr:non-ribosomal peptide synthetase [Thermomonospora echinospora]SEG83662.1 amino acid adenylation domain-containing protein [Thermomonospora echinospora]